MPSALVLSVNVGKSRDVEWSGRKVTTGIYKAPVHGPVRAVGVTLEGDEQADLRVHGGPDKAVYAFPSEHYGSWRSAYPGADWGWGAFGENLTLEGLLEGDVAIGDAFRCGDAEFVVRQPRAPCFKFAVRVGDKTAVKRMIDTGHTGFYLGIAKEGTLRAGDAFEYLRGPEERRLSVAAFTELYMAKDPDRGALAAAAENPYAPESWRGWFRDRLGKLEAADT